MRLSWREILGILIALAISYGVISYALTSAQNRETASEQNEPRPQQSEATRPAPAPPTTTPPPTPPSASEDTKTVTVRVTGYVGAPFSGKCCTRGSNRSVTGTVPTDYVLQGYDTDSPSADPIYATIRKTSGDDNMLRVQVLDGREVVESQGTTDPYGVVNLTWSPNQR